MFDISIMYLLDTTSSIIICEIIFNFLLDILINLKGRYNFYTLNLSSNFSLYYFASLYLIYLIIENLLLFYFFMIFGVKLDIFTNLIFL